MAQGFRNELKNVMTLYYLVKLDKKIPTDRDRALRKQNRKVHKVMKRAYRIPFYRERFEKSGTTPDDYHCAEDLYKFPLLTKDELRDWMDEEAAKDPEKYK